MRLSIVDKRITLRLVGIAVLSAVLISGCIQQGASEAQTGILAGTALAGPTCPGPEKLFSNCHPVVMAGVELLLQTVDGKQTLQAFRTDENGHFEVQVSPGTYRIHPVPIKPTKRDALPPIGKDDIIVKVTAGQKTLVEIGYDTGIR